MKDRKREADSLQEMKKNKEEEGRQRCLQWGKKEKEEDEEEREGIDLTSIATPYGQG